MVPVDPVTYHAYAGEYEASGLPRTIISTDAGQALCFGIAVRTETVRLYPSAEDHFFILEGNIEVNFRRRYKREHHRTASRG